MKKKANLLNRLEESLEKKPARAAVSAPAPAPIVAVSAVESEPVAKPAARPLRAEAEKLIYGSIPWAAAVGVVPVPLASAAAVAAIQINLVRRLCRLYGVAFSEQAVKSVFASLVGCGVTATVTTGTIGASLPWVPVVGPALSFVATPACAAATTFAIGKIFAAHFETGGNLLNIDATVFDAQFATEMSAAGQRVKRAASEFVHELKP